MNIIVAQAGLTLDTDVPDHLPHLAANSEGMTILVRNLLDNAIKYTRPGGLVTQGARALDHETEIRVSDTGVGIPADELPNIFERFCRVDRAHSRRPSTGVPTGAGLGLALVQAIVHANGGRVQVDSQVDAGSTFTVWLPFIQEYANGKTGNTE